MQRQGQGYIRKVEFAFYNEKELRDAVFEARAKQRIPELRNASGLSDPTAALAIRNLTPISSVKVAGMELRKPESWLSVVDKTYSWCKRQGDFYYEIARGRYSGVHFATICARIELVPEKFFRILEKIRNYAALQAAYLQLIQVD